MRGVHDRCTTITLPVNAYDGGVMSRTFYIVIRKYEFVSTIAKRR